MMPHTEYQGSRPCGFRIEDFFHVFPIISLCKTCDPQGGLICGEQTWQRLHTKYQGYRPFGFRLEDV